MKARIKQNVWGNWYGYLGSRKVIAFADGPENTMEQEAQIWLAGHRTSNPLVKAGDTIQIGTRLTTGEIFWGSKQIVIRVSFNGTPIYRPRYAKVDKCPDFWRRTHAGK